jgi:hypothetical protein
MLTYNIKIDISDMELDGKSPSNTVVCRLPKLT